VTSLFCGIDIGTTNLKVLLLDAEGHTAWVKSVAAPRLNDDLGLLTDATALLNHIEAMIIEGWRSVAQGRVIAAISTGGIGEDGVGVDGALQPLGHAIQWNDRRGEANALALAKTELARGYPAILLDFSSTAGKWQWLCQHRPQELAGAQHWITMTDYPLAVWSGTAFMSATLAPRTGCYDVFTRTWIPQFLAHCGAPPLPELIIAGTVVGAMKPCKLTEAGACTTNTLLVAGGHDHPVAASAIRRMFADARIDSMGTANATYGETTTLQPGHNLEGLYVTLPISGASGAAVIGMTEFSRTLGQCVPDVSELYAALLGKTHRADIPGTIRQALEELARHTKHYWSAMTRAGVPQAPVYATGGWARSPAVVQLRADIFEQPVTVVDEPELVALGAALFAAQGTGQRVPLLAAAEKIHVVHPTR
jgi:xylulokinase